VKKREPFEKPITLESDPEDGETVLRVSVFGPICGLSTSGSFERRVPDAVKKLHSAERSFDGMQKGRQTRFGVTEERQGRVQASFDAQRATGPKLSNTAMIWKAELDCKVHESTIRKWIRKRKVRIPPKT
jgi:hypothetical protein